ncbi:MAG: S41 family peptidase, partial [Bacteroidales bacterium]|nr:S41 family peptidase [Bacteroidales bacterium]
DKSGIKQGDRIVRIDKENITGKDVRVEHIRNLLQGEKGTTLSLEIIRPGKKEVIFKELQRDKISLNSITAAYKIEDNIAYIKLESFSANTIKEFEEISRSFRKNGVQNIILDLRNNGGGYLSTAIRLIDEFMPSDRLIIYTKGKNNPRYDYFSSGKGHFKRSKLVILINENSASASEIVAGAIQDWDRGLIVGRRSFGKGLVQRPFDLPDGSMIRLTVARYYTPTGRLIQKNYANGYENYVNEENNRFEHGELFFKDSIYFVDSLKYLTLNKKRTVYGGGGIIPDIFVAVDTNKFPKFYFQMLKSGEINRFIIDFIDKNREQLNTQYTNVADFDKNFEPKAELLLNIVKYAQENNLTDTLNRKLSFSKSEPDSESLNLALDIKETNIKQLLKALIARNLWGDEAFYKIYNKQDDFVLTAIDVLKNKHLYNSLLANSTF